MTSFYDDLAPFYPLIYPDWNTAIGRQAGALDGIIREHLDAAHTVLDISCGIGTQCLGLAQAGYQVTASDLSSEAVARASVEATARGLSIEFSVADMRHAFEHHGGGFDVVLLGDDSVHDAYVPHALLRHHGSATDRAVRAVGLRGCQTHRWALLSTGDRGP